MPRQLTAQAPILPIKLIFSSHETFHVNTISDGLLDASLDHDLCCSGNCLQGFTELPSVLSLQYSYDIFLCVCLSAGDAYQSCVLTVTTLSCFNTTSFMSISCHIQATQLHNFCLLSQPEYIIKINFRKTSKGDFLTNSKILQYKNECLE